MKKLLAAIGAFLLCTGLCFAADVVEGFWISYDEKTGNATAGWEIYQKDGRLYGEIRSVADYPQDVKAYACKESYKGFPVAGKVNEMTTCNTPWIFDLEQAAPGKWEGGSIIDPNSGKMYKCKIIFHQADGKKFTEDTLEMRGEIGLGIGRSQYWKRVEKEAAFALR